MIQISQRFARWLIPTSKFTIAKVDDLSRADNELIIFEIRCNDEAWDCIMMTQRMWKHQQSDDMNSTTDNSQIQTDVFNVFLIIQYLYSLVEQNNDDLLFRPERHTACRV